MLLLVSVYLTFIWFDCCPSFPPSVFLFHCVSHLLSLPLSSCLGCIPLLKGLPFLRSLLRIFFLPYAYYVAVFVSSAFDFACVICLFVFLFYCLCLFCVVLWQRCLLLATFLLVSFCLIFLGFFSDRVPGWTWSDSIYLLTTAGFVADQLI